VAIIALILLQYCGSIIKTKFQYMKRSESFANNSVRNAILVLEYLAKVDHPQNLSMISKALGMNKSTVYRLLSTLEESYYVSQNETTKQYSLGARVSWLSSRFLEKNEICSVARPYLETLSQKINETIHLGILEHSGVTYIDKINGREAVIMASRIGGRTAVHCTALGKALLAFQPESKWREYVEQNGLPARTENTITDPDQFYKELAKIRELGISIDNIENEEGIRCVASPIFDASNNVVAAVSVSSWIINMTMERVQQIVPLLQSTTAEISAHLGK